MIRLGRIERKLTAQNLADRAGISRGVCSSAIAIYDVELPLKFMVSGLTLLSLDEMMARYARYEGLAEIIRHRFRNASATLMELFFRTLHQRVVSPGAMPTMRHIY